MRFVMNVFGPSPRTGIAHALPQPNSIQKLGLGMPLLIRTAAGINVTQLWLRTCTRVYAFSNATKANVNLNSKLKPHLRWQSSRFWLSLPINVDIDGENLDVERSRYRTFMIHPEWTVKDLVNRVRLEDAEPEPCDIDESFSSVTGMETKKTRNSVAKSGSRLPDSGSGLVTFDILDKGLACPLNRELPISYPIAAGFIVSINSQKYELPPWPSLTFDYGPLDSANKGDPSKTINRALVPFRVPESAQKAAEVRNQLAKVRVNVGRGVNNPVPLSMPEFYEICRVSGIPNKADCISLLRSLMNCGVVAVDDANPNSDVIYLLPGDQDLTDAMSQKCFMRDFADTEFRSNVQCVSELHQLEVNKQKAEMLAKKRADQYFNAGLFLSVAGVSTLFYCTFFYLSWDIVEPVTFFISQGFSIAGYFWWLLSGEQPKYGAIHQHLYRRWRRYYTMKDNGDPARYSNLKHVLTHKD